MEMNRAILRFALTGLVAALLAGSAPSWSQPPAPEAGAKAYALPAELLRAAKRWKVDQKDVTIAVLPVDDVRRTEKDSNVTRVRPVLLHRADVSVAPASSAKVVTTLVALETLGSHYRWYTGFYADEKAEPDAKGVLRSPLYIKGGGDPNFVLEAFDLELTRLREKGIRRIEGDVVVDRSFFDVPETNRNAFDGRGSRPYNLPPDAALVNYRNLSFEMTPDPEKGVAHGGSFANFCGGAVKPEDYSLEKKVRPGVSPSFIWATTTDNAVAVENSVLLYSALHAAGIDVEMHIFAEGPHGLSTCDEEVYAQKPQEEYFAHCGKWLDLAYEFLRVRGFGLRTL